MSRTCVAVSPHLDDAVFSAGATLAHLATSGWTTTLVTVFTASVPDPQGFALECQRDKGLADDVDYLALRREEDRAAAAVLGVDRVVHLEFAEAPHRDYGSPAELFAGVHDDDPLDGDAVVASLRPLLTPADLVLAPQGLGAHVDHEQVVRAVARCGAADRTGWWRDTPYVLRDPGAAPSPSLPAGLGEQPVAVAAHVAAKVDACRRYASQVGFHLGGEQRLAQDLQDLADAEGRRASAPQASEVLLAPTGLLAWLDL